MHARPMTHPGFVRHHLRAILGAGALVILTTAYAAWWLYASGLLKSELSLLQERGPAVGITAQWSAIALTGFPFAVAADLEKPVYANDQIGFGWTGETLRVSFRPWSLSPVRFVAPGQQRWIVAQGENTITIDAHAKAAAASYASAPERVTLDTEETRGTVQWAETSLPFTVARAKLSGSAWIDKDKQQSLAKAVALIEADGLILQGLALPLGPKIDRLRLDAEIAPPGPQTPATVKLASAQFAADGVEIKGAGTLTLDAQGTPEGTLDLTVRGLPRLAEAMGQKGLLTASAAMTVKMAAGLIATDQTEVSLPLRFTQGQMFLGPAPLGPAPRLVF